jgi:hypothetical protein
VPKQGETARRPAWPEDAVFRRLVLDVESDSCEHCGATLHVCDHRFHRIHTLRRAGAGKSVANFRPLPVAVAPSLPPVTVT